MLTKDYLDYGVGALGEPLHVFGGRGERLVKGLEQQLRDVPRGGAQLRTAEVQAAFWWKKKLIY